MVQLPATAAIEYVAACWVSRARVIFFRGCFCPGVLPGGTFGRGDFWPGDFCPGVLLFGGLLPGGTFSPGVFCPGALLCPILYNNHQLGSNMSACKSQRWDEDSTRRTESRGPRMAESGA